MILPILLAVEVLWTEPAQTAPRFVSAAAIERGSTDAALAARADLREFLALLKTRYETTPDKIPLPIYCGAPVTGPAAPEPTIEELIRRNDVAATFEVVELTPGWNLHENLVSTVITLRAAYATRGVDPGDRLTIERFGGAFRFEGEDVRNESLAGLPIPAFGDRFFIIAKRDEANPTHLTPIRILPVQEP